MKNAMTITKNTVSATYLPYAAYKSALALATAHKGEIGKTDKGNFMATFGSAKVAKQFVDEWTAEYEANRKPVTEHAPKPAQKPTASKPTEPKPTASARKPKADAPKKSKGNKPTLNDFVKANPSCTRDEAKAYGFKGTRADLKALKVTLGVR
jgi:hypothetical protein